MGSAIKKFTQALTAAGLALLDDADAAAQRATLGLSFDNILPWAIEISVLTTPDYTLNWPGTYSNDVAHFYAWAIYSSGAQNDLIGWDVVLAAGTWSVEVIHSTGPNRGIYSVQINDVEKATFDGYAGGELKNQRNTVTGIAIATTGKYSLKLKMLTKHASSSSYYGYIYWLRLKRTA